jgi:hypothetical protein
VTQTLLQRRLIRLAHAINKKAERVGARGRVSAETLLLIALDYPQCPYCGVDIDPMHGSFDHKVPFHRGGSNERSNILFCCMTCQRSKFTKSVSEHEEFLHFTVTCPVDGTVFKPRYADWKRGLGRYCSRNCSASSRWLEGAPSA